MMEAVCISETSVFSNKTTQGYIPAAASFQSVKVMVKELSDGKFLNKQRQYVHQNNLKIPIIKTVSCICGE
jgi:hypothetical protein